MKKKVIIRLDYYYLSKKDFLDGEERGGGGIY
jgi:hypothetical protein